MIIVAVKQLDKTGCHNGVVRNFDLLSSNIFQ